MEEKVHNELQALKGMVLTWKRSYLQEAPTDGQGDFLVQEFLEEIEMHIYPYTKRLFECDYLSSSEAKEFLEFCYGQVEDLHKCLCSKTFCEGG